MAFKFNKKIKLGKGFGVHISKSGITPSYRNKRGSLSSKGYSVKTGIPGVTYRKTFSKSKQSGCLLIFLVLLGFLPFSCSKGGADTPCSDTNCANYTSQSSAQAAFDADPECRNDLDADKDGIACEELGNSVKDCNTTSNCGCSNKNKAACQSDPCCQWIVGEGCRCS
ncbi:DUF4236 domain-containing protein [Aquimarina sp. ERC-38]|uniref:DUF4236 domain-containing protein n=1 Tax=Aquimarina sp. ERC-38 TaxID=2949996 RepID=UPI002247151A|nr:DUF4236 domain-containing protein [Aquimarina sp. ERC-38]UZO81532.1 DUF4236 domain-containing protein [Aquimarina sp. ERC-38]